MRFVLVALLVFVRAHAAGATITGRVMEAGTTQPLPRVLVTLVAAGGGQPLETLTDDRGRYRFESVPAGRYAISAGPVDRVATHLRQWYGEEVSAPPWGAPPRFPLRIDGDSETVADIAMVRALAIEGRVLAPWDEGLANVGVRALHPDGREATPNPFYTDDRGHYRAFGLAPGRYRLCADVRDRGAADAPDVLPLARTCHPAAAGEGSASDVTLTTADVTGIDIRVQRTGGRTIAGTIVDTSGAPAHGAVVFVTSIDRMNLGGDAAVRDGTFSFRGLVPGVYAVHSAIVGSGTPSAMSFAIIDVTAVDAPAVAMTMAMPIAIRGRVVPPEGADRARFARTVIHVMPLESRLMSFAEPKAFAAVSPDLTFEVPEVYSLPVLIVARGLPDGWTIERIRYGAQDITHRPAELTSARETLEIVVTDRVVQPLVRVIGDDGRARANTRVLACPAAAMSSAARHRCVDARADDTGIARLPASVPGDYIVAAVTREDMELLFMDPSRFTALLAVGTRMAFRPGVADPVDLKVVPLPAKQ
jgi:hypothetical protein